MRNSLCYLRRALLLGLLAILFHSSSFGQETNATVVITKPQDGASFDSGTAISISAKATDPSGYIPRVEFYETNLLIGVSTINFLVPPPNGTPIQHSIVWSNATPGLHEVRAVGISSTSNTISSESIHINVLLITNQTIVRIVATDPEATEFSGPDTFIDPAVFTLSREGPTNDPVTVLISFQGTAQPKYDYLIEPAIDATENGVPITIPAGESETTIKITPVRDVVTYIGPMKTVGVHLEYSPLAGPFNNYHIDPLYREAAAVIYDSAPPTNGAIEFALASGNEQFAVGQDIDLLVAGVHPLYGVHRVEFFVDGYSIGVSEDDSNTEKTVYTHAFTWANAPQGLHVLGARAEMPDGSVLTTSGFGFRVGEPPITPMVSIHFVPDPTDRPTPNADYAPGFLRIDRLGPTNKALELLLFVGGTATPGVDYQQMPWSVVIPAGQQSLFLTVNAIDDTIPEPNETVIVTIYSLLPLPGEEIPYIIDPTAGSATVTIYDNDSNPQTPPVVRMTSPNDLSTLDSLQPVVVSAEAESSNSVIDFIELRLDGLPLARTNGAVISYLWATPTLGIHNLTAFAQDTAGLVSTSAPVRIYVAVPDHPTAIRDLPDQYIPGVPFKVSLSISVHQFPTYAVEDIPPTGWVVSDISQGGVFDALTGKVKFGPYLEGTDGVLTYTVTPATNSSGTQTFFGTVAFGPLSSQTTGDSTIDFTPEFHPADQNTNATITVSEVTSYAYAWKYGSVWDTPPNPIPIDYVTRAALIWRKGESYRFDPTRGSAPLCWVPASGTTNTSLAALTLATSIRSGLDPLPGESSTIQIAVSPDADASSYAVVEKLPSGWAVTGISDDGLMDSTSGVIRWGPFFDANPRTLSYTVTAPAGVASAAHLAGTVSIDGESHTITGKSLLTATDESTVVKINSTERSTDGAVHFSVSSAPGQFVKIETSDDLVHWTVTGSQFISDGSAEITAPAGTTHQFYRLRVD